MKKVVKFGGSSLASAEQFKKVGAIIRADESRVYVVPSAPGKRFPEDTKVTDMLLHVYETASAGDDITEELKAIEADVQDWLDSVVGKLNKPLLPDEKIKMASNGNTIADFINTIQLHYSGAMVSAVSLANEIKGFNQSVTRRDIIATYPYPNTLVVFEMTGKQLREELVEAELSNSSIKEMTFRMKRY